MSTRSVRITST